MWKLLSRVCTELGIGIASLDSANNLCCCHIAGRSALQMDSVYTSGQHWTYIQQRGVKKGKKRKGQYEWLYLVKGSYVQVQCSLSAVDLSLPRGPMRPRRWRSGFPCAALSCSMLNSRTSHFLYISTIDLWQVPRSVRNLRSDSYSNQCNLFLGREVSSCMPRISSSESRQQHYEHFFVPPFTCIKPQLRWKVNWPWRKIQKSWLYLKRFSAPPATSPLPASNV